MPYAFNHLDLIEELLKRSPLGLITDVDGTISPTAPTPQQAQVSPLCHHYLAILCHQLALVAAVSGRPALEVKNMVGIDGMVYIGNHGLERWAGGRSEFVEGAQDYLEVIKATIKELMPPLSMEGINIENKGVTATIHYRLYPEHQSARNAILAAIENSPHAKRLRVMQESKYAFNLLPPIGTNKGTATRYLIKEHDLRGGIYLGDDTTDIDAFRAIRAASRDSDFQGLAIGIAGREMPENLETETDFTLNGVGDVERFLKWISQTLPQVSV